MSEPPQRLAWNNQPPLPNEKTASSPYGALLDSPIFKTVVRVILILVVGFMAIFALNQLTRDACSKNTKSIGCSVQRVVGSVADGIQSVLNNIVFIVIGGIAATIGGEAALAYWKDWKDKKDKEITDRERERDRDKEGEGKGRDRGDKEGRADPVRPPPKVD
jgi:hypothetical protein